MNARDAALLAMLAAAPGILGSEVRLPRGRRRRPAPQERDLRAELEPYVGKTWRHRFTGQVRDVFAVLEAGVSWGQRRSGDRGVGLPMAKHRKALDWLRNAVEVGA